LAPGRHFIESDGIVEAVQSSPVFSIAMLELLFTATAAQLGKVVLDQVLELGKGALEEYVKDFFKGSLGSGVAKLNASVLKEPMGEAIGAFIKAFVQELKANDVPQTSIDHHYTKALRGFVKDNEVKPILGKAFDTQCDQIDYGELERIWTDRHQQPGWQFPEEDFRWKRVATAYVEAVKEIVKANGELRELLKLDLAEQQTESLKQLQGIPVGFDLSQYRDAILDQYGSLRLESLGSAKYETQTVNYRTVSLWEVFIPQMARGCQDYVPQAYKLPKEYLKRAQASGDIEQLEEWELEQRQESYGQQIPQSILEIVGSSEGSTTAQPPDSYVVILGDPGSGKSTVLRYLAVNWAKNTVDDADLQTQIPLLIELRGYSQSRAAQECRDFIEFVHKGSNWVNHLDQHQLDDWLRDGKVLMMLDGLDEVVDRQARRTVLKQIHDFTQDYPKVPVILTSRVIGYNTEDLGQAGFQHYMLQDLNQDQIDEFIEIWHGLTYGDAAERERKQDRLQRAVRQSRAIQELAGNPLLLTLMAILNRGEELPRDRARLYEKASEVLLYQWDVEEKLLKDERLEKYPIEIDFRDKQKMLRRVAATMQNSDKGLAGNFIQREELEHCLTDYLETVKKAPSAPSIAAIMIEQLGERNFILCFLGDDAYAFVHRTFLEYFCATEIKERFDKRGAKGGLSFEELRDEVFAPHWQDETWHEVLRLIIGMIDTQFAGELIEWLLEQPISWAECVDSVDRLQTAGFTHLLLAANCLDDVKERATIRSVDQQVLNQLKKEIEDEFINSSSNDAAQALVQSISTHWSEHPQLLNWLRDWVSLFSESYVPGHAVEAIARLQGKQTQTFDWLKARAQDPDEHNNVRNTAIKALAERWRDNSKTLSFLKSIVQKDKNGFVRSAAIGEIALGWKDHPGTLPLLKTLVQDKQHWIVRSMAMRLLVRGWEDDPDILNILINCVEHDESDTMRETAVEEIARGWKNNPNIFIWLKNCTRSSSDGVRYAALQELVRGWKDDPDTIATLKSSAQFDKSLRVRSIALQELAQGWKDDPNIFYLLQDLAQNDSQGPVKLAAIQALCQMYKDNLDVLSWLKIWAQDSNEDGGLRFAAVLNLAREWKHDPGTLPILKKCAQDDKHENTCCVALRELAREWNHDPDTLPILKKRAQDDSSGYVRLVAVRELARVWGQQDELFKFFESIAVNDSFERTYDWQATPRQVALAVLVKYHGSNPQTREVLRDRTINDPDPQLRGWAQKKLNKLEQENQTS
jgi:energy-coupling factor transporter ATP-binding protein EcfA2